MDEYNFINDVVIGLEIHIELDTKTKLFCACSTKANNPNTRTCEVCLGYPGSKPVLNKKVVDYALRLGLATKSNISNIGHQKEKLQEFLRRIVGVRIKQYNLTKLISEGAIYFLASFMNPIYKNLKPLIGENKLEPYFVTGCQNCNKRIRVNIPLDNYNHRFNTIRWMLKKVLRINTQKEKKK